MQRRRGLDLRHQCGPSEYRTICSKKDVGIFPRECLPNGETLGTCDDAAGAFGNCCTAFFAPPS